MSLEVFNDLGVAVIAEHQVMLSIEAPAKKVTDTVKVDNTAAEWILWGDSNDYPQTVIDKCAANTIIPSTVAWKANQLASCELETGYHKVQEDGSKKFVSFSLPEIDEFIEANSLDLFVEETLRDLFWWNMAIADIGLNPSRNKIVSLVSQDMTECRFSKQNPTTGLKDFIFLSANWPTTDKNYISKLRSLDPYYDVQGQITNGKDVRYAFPLFLSVPKRKAYQDAPWHSIINSKWLDITDKIPKLKAKLMDNQMHIKYVIHIPLSWWIWKYKNWNNLKAEEQVAKQAEELAKFNSIFTGVDNVGKTIMATYNDSQQGRDYAKWEIKELTARFDSNMYIEDSQEASSHILYALNVDGTLIGNSPGKQMGAGSGSDKRSAYNIFILANRIYQKKVVTPLNAISTYNGWKSPTGEKIVFQFKNEMLSTQSEQSTKNRI
jgi:hypothetical protein